MELIRADVLLIQQGIAKSRSHASELIKNGHVRAAGRPVLKPGSLIKKSISMELIKPSHPYVSRGGVKLEHALHSFRIDPAEKIVLDCGASTGGFTDCVLQRGAKKVYAVDVGYGQFDWKLRNNPSVVVLERTNLRIVPVSIFSDKFDLAVLDMSFISLKLVLQKVMELLTSEGEIAALLKPQFEAGKDRIGAGGVVRNPELHKTILEEMATFVRESRWSLRNMTKSPVKGPKGNIEFFLHIKRDPIIDQLTVREMIEEVMLMEPLK